jgi:phenylalanyl-tRNA synthetase beta chain
MNQVYPKNLGFDDEKVPQGVPQLGFVFVDGAEQGNYYLAKKYLESLLGALGVKYELGKFTNSSTNSYYEPKRSASIIAGNMTIGYLGEIKGMVARSFKLPRGVAAFELDLTALLALARGAAAKTFRLSNYPSVSRDLTLTVAGDTIYAELEGKIRDALKDYIYQLRPVSIYQADGADTKNISFHLEFAHPDKTLTKAEIQDIMNTLESIK